MTPDITPELRAEQARRKIEWSMEKEVKKSGLQTKSVMVYQCLVCRNRSGKSVTRMADGRSFVITVTLKNRQVNGKEAKVCADERWCATLGREHTRQRELWEQRQAAKSTLAEGQQEVGG